MESAEAANAGQCKDQSQSPVKLKMVLEVLARLDPLPYAMDY